MLSGLFVALLLSAQGDFVTHVPMMRKDHHFCAWMPVDARVHLCVWAFVTAGALRDASNSHDC
jgi:hypothetical protein